MLHASTVLLLRAARHPTMLNYLRPVVMVTQGRIDCQVGEVLSDGLGHVTDHLDHYICRELIWRDVRWTVTGGEGKTRSSTIKPCQIDEHVYLNAAVLFTTLFITISAVFFPSFLYISCLLKSHYSVFFAEIWQRDDIDSLKRQ